MKIKLVFNLTKILLLIGLISSIFFTTGCSNSALYNENNETKSSLEGFDGNFEGYYEAALEQAELEHQLATRSASYKTSPYGDEGSYSTIYKRYAGPLWRYALVYPSDLGRNGVKHPIITWGNGTGASPEIYKELLEHLASHGFVVIASRSMMTGSGTQMIKGVDWLIDENSRRRSKFYNTLDINAIGATGHSQGGGGTLAAGNDSRIKCTVPIQPTTKDVEGLKGPMFVITGSLDIFVPPVIVYLNIYLKSRVETVYGKLNGATHFTTLGDAGKMRQYITAWFYTHLYNDENARSIFYGNDADILNDSDWEVERKNL